MRTERAWGPEPQAFQGLRSRILDPREGCSDWQLSPDNLHSGPSQLSGVRESPFSILCVTQSELITPHTCQLVPRTSILSSRLGSPHSLLCILNPKQVPTLLWVACSCRLQGCHLQSPRPNPCSQGCWELKVWRAVSQPPAQTPYSRAPEREPWAHPSDEA